MKRLFLFVVILLGGYSSYAQTLLNKTVSVNADQKPLSAVLDNISMQGKFHFSYVKDFIHDDSLVTIHVADKPVKQILDMLFQGNFQFREIGDQIIIQPGTSSKEKWYVVSGHVNDAITGKPVHNASVYEGVLLISTLTNEQGYFRIRLREKERTAALLTVSKELYKDTIMLIPAARDQEISASIKPAPPIQLAVVDVNQHSHVEQTFLGRFFLSSRQRMQSLNLSNFFAKQPYQYSIVPAIGTHGKIGSQVINKFSLNMIGGYAAGLNGVEIAGIFNIDQKDVKYAQVAGIFNIVGGHFSGGQIAGIHNHVMDSLDGVQVAGISNILKYSFHGAQVAGIYSQAGGEGKGAQISGILNNAGGHLQGTQIAGAVNLSRKTLKGAQIGGAVNLATDSIKGVQIAGAINFGRTIVEGAQIAGAVNYSKGGGAAQIAGAVNINLDTTSIAQISGAVNVTRVLKGVQIGIVNYADSSDGFSFGLLNIVRKGYHQLQIYNNEVFDINLAYKSGSRKSYSLLLAGMSLNNSEKAYTIGYGVGHDFRLNTRNYITTELTSQFVYLGSWGAANTLIRLQPSWNWRLINGVTLFAGPVFSLYYSDNNDVIEDDYKANIPGRYSTFSFSPKLTGWFGWHIGVGFF